MKAIEMSNKGLVVELSQHELAIIRNALKDAMKSIGDWEFPLLTGFTLEEADDLLHTLTSCYEEYEVIYKLGRLNDQKKYPCACCGFLTKSQPYSQTFEICSVCFWEDDCSEDDVDYTGGANSLSLRDARQNFKKFKVCSLEFLEHVRPPLPDELPD